MELSYRIQDGILIINLNVPSLDAKNSSEIKQNIIDLVGERSLYRVILDLNELHFIDSSGLGCFLSIAKFLIHKEGILKLARINRPILTMFELVSMHRNFERFNTVEEAVNSFH